jgi:hypothetical protein
VEGFASGFEIARTAFMTCSQPAAEAVNYGMRAGLGALVS